MRRIDRRMLLAGAGAGLLSGCSIGDDLSGAARKQPKGGIGGTGIVGTLTDFGSLIVNGLRVNVPVGLPVGTAFGPVAQDRLAVGQNLTIEAETITGGLIARRVDIVHPVIGMLEDVSASGREQRVAGIAVQVERGAFVQADPGQQVAVSGVWNSDTIVASRVVAIEVAPRVIVSGTARRAAASGGWAIGAMPVLLPDDGSVEDGSFAVASGFLHGAALNVTSLRSGRFVGAAGALTALSVEGFLAPTPEAPFHSVDGLGHSFSEDAVLEPYVGKRTLFTGGYTGAFDVQNGLVLEQSFDARRRQLSV